MKFKKEAMLAVILFFGLFLRIYNISAESIWQDEGFSITLAHMNVSQLIHTTAGDVHPPLYYLLLHYWIAIFGDSEFSSRCLSALFGFFSIFMIYKVGTLLFNRNAGLLDALVLALSALHVHYSQVARMYSLMVLLTLLSFYYFIRLLREKSLRVSIGYILCTVLLMYTHIYGLFIVTAQNIYSFATYLSTKKTGLRKWVLLQGILLILYLPWVHILTGQILKKVERGYWIPVPTVFSIIETFKQYAGAAHSSFSLPLFFVPLLLLMLRLKRNPGHVNKTSPLTSLKDFSGDEEESAFKSIPLLSVWLFTPIILPFVISFFSQPIYQFRYTIGASLAFYLLVAAGIEGIRFKPFRMLLICAVILVSLANVWGYYKTPHKSQWREVGNYLNQNARSGDLILIIPKGGRRSGKKARTMTKNSDIGSDDLTSPGQRGPVLSEVALDYYFKRTDVVKKIFRARTAKRRTGKDIGTLCSVVRDFDRVWVTVGRGVDNSGLVKKTLSECYKLVYSKKYRGPQVYLFVRNE